MSISTIYSNSYLSKAQVEQLRPVAGAQTGRSSSDALDVNAISQEDTVTISETALKLQESSENMDGRNEDAFASPNQGKQAAGGATVDGEEQAAAGASSGGHKIKNAPTAEEEAAESNQAAVDAIKKMITSVEEKLVKAEEKLAEVQMKAQQTSKESTDGGVEAEIAQAEMQGVTSEINVLNNQLMGLREELADAISGEAAKIPGPPGAAGGTRAMGSGSSLS